MRSPLWSTLLFLPALCHAQVHLSNTSVTPATSGTARVMSIQATQTATFEGSLDQLHERLQLTDAQQPAWIRYADSVQAYSAQFFSEKPHSAYAAEAAPRQVKLLAERLQGRVDAIREIERTAKTLYAQLSTQQQKTADQHLLASIPSFGFPPSAPYSISTTQVKLKVSQ
jgi:hypothetical protein